MASRLTTIIVLVIVGATFIAGLIVGAQRDDASGPVDLIVLNGRVYPGLGRPLAEALAVRGNQILSVGSNREIKRLRRPQTVVLDAHGGAVLPGFNDSHVRFLEAALTLDQLDVSEATTPEEIRAMVGMYAESNRSRRWILGRDGHLDALSPNVPARWWLDEAAPDRPAMVTSRGGRIAWTNSAALELAGITRKTRSPRGGAIVKDPNTGEPLGMLTDAAVELVTRVLPEPTRVEKLSALRSAIAESHRAGVTSIHTVSASEEELDLLSEIRREDALTLRVYGSIAVSPDMKEERIAELDQLRERYPDDPILKAGGIEVACSGPNTLKEAGTGIDTHSGGTPRPCDPEGLERLVTLLDKKDWQILVRPSDEADVEAALDAFEHAAAVNPAPTRERRHRMEHLGGISELDLRRAVKLGLIVETSLFDQGPADVQPALWNVLEEVGARILLGSHWPAEPLRPQLHLEEALAPSVGTAEPEDRSPHAETLLAALDAYSSQAGYAAYDEQRKGTLATGMLADIVVLSNDIFEASRERLRDADVDVTIFDGKVVYQRSDAPTDD